MLGEFLADTGDFDLEDSMDCEPYLDYSADAASSPTSSAYAVSYAVVESPAEKYRHRRDLNNEACKRSRAKRRMTREERLQERDDLEARNENLKVRAICD